MHIALLSAEYPPQPGGVGDYTARLGEALARRGHTISTITSAANVRGSGALHPIGSWGWRSWREVAGALERIRPDVLHIQYQTGAYGMHPAINLLPRRLRGRRARPPIVVTAHDLLVPYLFPKAGPLRSWVTRRLIRDADAVVATNAADLAQIARWRAAGDPAAAPQIIPIGSNIAVAPPPGYDRAAWRARLGVAPGQTLTTYFGLASRSKGLDTLLDALARLPARFRLIVVGGAAPADADRAYAERQRRRIEAPDLRDRVVVTGHCAADEVSAHLLAADLGALPFADGASPRRGSLIALLAHGVPTVTTRAPQPLGERGGPRAPEDGDAALLTPPGEPAALAEALLRLEGDAALRERLAAGGRAWAAQFAWETIAARHEKLYRNLVAERD